MKTLFCILTRVRIIMDSTAPCFVNVIVSYFDFTARGKILDSTTRCFVIGSTRLLSIAMDCHWIAIPPISSDILLKIVSSKMILINIYDHNNGDDGDHPNSNYDDDRIHSKPLFPAPHCRGRQPSFVWVLPKYHNHLHHHNQHNQFLQILNVVIILNY